MTTSAPLNPHAKSSFAKASAYDTHRPAYSSTIVQLLLEKLGVAGRHGAVLVDLAAGTGKLTEALAKREEEYEVIAIEPHDEMREVLAKKGLPRVRVVNARSDEMGLEEGSVDAVLVAQAFHWFANASSLKEIHRVLKRHSGLGLVWNAEDYTLLPRDHTPKNSGEAQLQQVVFDTVAASNDHEPRFRDMAWREVFEQQSKKTPLSLIVASNDVQEFSLPLGQHLEPFEVALSDEGVWDRLSTLGHIAALDDEAREKVKAKCTEALKEVQRDGDGRTVLHGNTWAIWTTKIPEEGADGLADVQAA